MKRFKFKLEPVERVRAVRERQALGELAKIRALLSQGEEFRDRLKQEISENLAKRAKLGSSGNTAKQADFQLANAHVLGLQKRKEQAERLLVRMRKEEKKALDAYLFAKKQVGVIENLKEKVHADYRVERSRFETKEADDLFAMRHRHRKKEAA